MLGLSYPGSLGKSHSPLVAGFNMCPILPCPKHFAHWVPVFVTSVTGLGCPVLLSLALCPCSVPSLPILCLSASFFFQNPLPDTWFIHSVPRCFKFSLQSIPVLFAPWSLWDICLPYDTFPHPALPWSVAPCPATPYLPHCCTSDYVCAVSPHRLFVPIYFAFGSYPYSYPARPLLLVSLFHSSLQSQCHCLIFHCSLSKSSPSSQGWFFFFFCLNHGFRMQRCAPDTGPAQSV